MGGGGFTSSDYRSFASTHVDGKSREEIFTSKLREEFNPLHFKFRESCDSEEHPNSTPIIVALDVTGSMGMIAEDIARHKLETLVTEIYDRKPITDPQLCFMGIGDVEMDQAPIQATQFESDIRIAKQLIDIYLEGGGGGNSYESYSAAWYFGAYRTKIDSYLKHNRKGYLFTIGDELPTKVLTKAAIKEFFGDDVQSNFTPEQLLTAVEQYYHVYHIIIAEGNYACRRLDEVKSEWNKLLGQRSLVLQDYTKLSELIVSTIQVTEGTDIDKVVESWDGSTSLVIKNAIGKMSMQKVDKETGIVTL